MPLSRVLAHASSDRNRPCLSANGRTWSYQNVVAAAARLVERIERQDCTTIGIRCKDAAGFLSAILGVHALRRDAIVLPTDLRADVAARLARDLGATCLLSDLPSDQSSEGYIPWSPALGDDGSMDPVEWLRGLTRRHGGGRVIVPTSGTSGRVKAAVHTWKSLAAAVRCDPKYADARWLLTYPLSRFAGLQVLLQCLLNGACLAVADSLNADDLSRVMREGRITHVSGTPTFWCNLLLGTTRRQRSQWRLVQITLGGEVVPQHLLDRLGREFPAARITHIYASTEMGVCLSIHDGQAGFPRNWLERPPAGVLLRIQDGQLLVRCTRAMQRYASGPPRSSEWFATGDLVEVRGDRVHFLGRKDDIINVGGAKVVPVEVEQCIWATPGVRTVRVCGQTSSIVGRLVRAEIVAEVGVDLGQLRARVVDQCRSKLAGYKVPRIITFVDRIAVTPAGKVPRG